MVAREFRDGTETAKPPIAARISKLAGEDRFKGLRL
jgi:hypothetical protein